MTDRELPDAPDKTFQPPSPYDEPTGAFRRPESATPESASPLISDADRDAFYARHHRRPGRLSRVDSFDDLDPGEVETRPIGIPQQPPPRRNPVPIPPEMAASPGTVADAETAAIEKSVTEKSVTEKSVTKKSASEKPAGARSTTPEATEKLPATPIRSVEETFPDLSRTRAQQAETPTRALLHGEEPLPTTRALGEYEKAGDGLDRDVATDGEKRAGTDRVEQPETGHRRRGAFGRRVAHDLDPADLDPHDLDPADLDPADDASTVEAARAEPITVTAPRGTLDLGLLLLRLAVGIVAVAHGLSKLFGIWGGPGLSGYQQMLANNPNPTIGFHADVTRPLAIVGTFAETIGGAMVVLGLFTPIGACAIVSVMLLAAAYKTTLAGGLAFFAAAGGIEYELVLAVAAAALVLTGPGLYAFDAARGWARRPFLGSVAWLIVGIVAAVAVWMLFNGTNPLNSPGNPQ
ncbi:DoxX family protein [Gordonia oryzae]|uniref:DoxX family protein n=1 Tax=Gordonia oryzae TaxID=2487349 RepID=A0A3N4GLJ6_9ACTN|nr:DoxX family protein [Gordonia oryzae]RPA62247.1 DoxX family protein [Gordonia oryzae]